MSRIRAAFASQRGSADSLRRGARLVLGVHDVIVYENLPHWSAPGRSGGSIEVLPWEVAVVVSEVSTWVLIDFDLLLEQVAAELDYWRVAGILLRVVGPDDVPTGEGWVEA